MLSTSGLSSVASFTPQKQGLLRGKPADAVYYVDMDTQEVFRDGAYRPFSDLTLIGGNRYTHDLDTGLDMATSSGYIEISVDATPVGDVNPFTMSNGNSANRFEAWNQSDGSTRLYDSGRADFVPATFTDGGGGNARWTRYRMFWNYDEGSVRQVWNGYSEASSVATSVAMPLLDEIGIGYNRQFGGFIFDGTVHKICIFDTSKTRAQLLPFVLRERTQKPFHWLGDSFLNSGQIRHDFEDLLAARGQYYFASEDQVGSTSLTQQAVRYASTTEYHDSTLIIVDGGLLADDSSVAALTSIVGNINHDRWLYVQSNPILATGVGDRPNWDDEDAAILAYCGASHYLETKSVMQAASSGGDDDTDVANDIWPRSLLEVDVTHPNAAGQLLLAQTIYNRVLAEGWLA